MSNQEAPETAWFRAREEEANAQLEELAAPSPIGVAAETEKDLGLASIDAAAKEQLEEIIAPMVGTVAGSTERDLGLADIDAAAKKQLGEMVTPAPSVAAGLARELGL